MKKLSIYLFLILFSFQTSSWADDIRDYEIEGVNIGDSLLDYYSESEIKKQLSLTVSKYISKRIKRIFFGAKDNSQYMQYNFHFINDSSYRIVALTGVMFYENDIDGCYKKQLEVSKDIESDFSKVSKSSETFKHSADKTGKSKVKQIRFILKGGEIIIACTSWSKTIKKDRPWRDTLSVNLESDEFISWLSHEAY